MSEEKKRDKEHGTDVPLRKRDDDRGGHRHQTNDHGRKNNDTRDTIEPPPRKR